jgi:hypothetical protein
MSPTAHSECFYIRYKTTGPANGNTPLFVTQKLGVCTQCKLKVFTLFNWTTTASTERAH